MTATTDQPTPKRPAADALDALARLDHDVLDRLRDFLDREQRGGATVVRIEHVRALLGGGR